MIALHVQEFYKKHETSKSYRFSFMRAHPLARLYMARVAKQHWEHECAPVKEALKRGGHKARGWEVGAGTRGRAGMLLHCGRRGGKGPKGRQPPGPSWESSCRDNRQAKSREAFAQVKLAAGVNLSGCPSMTDLTGL